ncbi:high-temperature-induced dauer-formation protein-domain-containing protein [Gongronella butleri]|nr:high-temperature-induced dauer-formation protein-domain-containing protein [Gongronella butleri]
MGTTDSKLAFRKGVFRLYEEQNIAASDEYWTGFWSLPESLDDIYALIGANDIRKIRDTSKPNLETLIDKLLDRIDTIVHAPSFPSPEFPVTHLLNCIRILTRLVPMIFESAENAHWEGFFFWTPRTVKRPGATDPKDQYENIPPRGHQLLKLTIELLYLAGFTVPAGLVKSEGTSRIVYAIWEDGVGSSKSLGMQRDLDQNRTEVLQLLTVLFSKSIYTTPSHALAKEDLWMGHVMSKLDKKTVLVLLCSLLNTACKYDPVGWGVPYNHILVANPREPLVAMCLRTLLILLDYRSPPTVELMHELDQHRQFVPPNAQRAENNDTDDDNSSNSSNNGPDARHDANGDHADDKDGADRRLSTASHSTEIQSILSSADEISDTHDNPFKYYLSKLHRTKDFALLMDGIHRILMNPLQASNTYLPRSTKRIPCNIEMLMLCWRLMECNQRFKDYLTNSRRCLDLMVILIYYSIESKGDIAQVGVVRMCAFILQTLSSEREFGIQLNTPFTTHSSLPALARLPAFHGTYGDYLINSIVGLITSTHGSLASLYPALILAITNVSPYLKNLSVTTASRLVGLFNSVSAPIFMIADESNHRLTGYLLEILNNIIQYHFADNPNVIYAIVRNHTKFDRLFNFTLAEGLAEIDRLRQLKEDKRRSSLEGGDSKSALAVAALTTSPLTSAHGYPKFKATEAWVQLWFPQFPVDTIRATLGYLVPQVEKKCQIEGLTTDAQILDYLRTVTMVGILPQRHPIFIRKFQWGEALVIWFRSMLWGQAYLAAMLSQHSPWNGTNVRLFQIKHEKPGSNTSSPTSASRKSRSSTSSPTSTPPPSHQQAVKSPSPNPASSQNTAVSPTSPRRPSSVLSAASSGSSAIPRASIGSALPHSSTGPVPPPKDPTPPHPVSSA